MLLSMTGFASQTAVLPVADGEETVLTVEIKTLNSRYFESSCKLPSSLSFLEIPIVNQLKEKLLRGRVFISIKLSGNGGAFERVVPVAKVIKGYLSATQMIKKELKVKGELTLSDIVSLPNTFSLEREEVGKGVETAIIKVINKVTDQLVKVRKAEGLRLEKDLKKRFDHCSKSIDKVKKLFDAFMKRKKTEVKKVIALAQKGDPEAEKQVGECYDLINKIDIHEEIVRFGSHLNGVKKLFAAKQLEKGKRFEFTLQELGREVNTIAAKCSNFDISSSAVDLKVELEKVREQIQNIV